MSNILHWLAKNRDWVFSGLGVTLLAFIGGLIWKRFFPSNNEPKSLAPASTVTNTQGSPLLAHNTGKGNVYVHHEIHQHQALTISDVREIAQTVWDANFPKLRMEAMIAARSNVEGFISILTPKLTQQLNREEFERFREPEIQYSFNIALQTAALRKEPELHAALSDLILERVRAKAGGLQGLIYGEAIKTVSTLTPEMMNFLAVYAFVRLVRVTNVKEWSDLASVFEMAIKPLLTFSISVLEMQHLIYAGCATPTGGTLHTEFTHFFQRHYATLFQRMVTPAEMQSCLGQTKQPWLNELFKSPVGESVAFRFASNAEFEKFLDSKKLHGEERSKYQRLFGQAFPSAAVSLKRLIAAIPSFQLLAEKWDRDCPLNNYHVTSVGRAIAQCRLLNLTRPNLEIVDDSPLFTSPQTF